jgi:hypothetical protein
MPKRGPTLGPEHRLTSSFLYSLHPKEKYTADFSRIFLSQRWKRLLLWERVDVAALRPSPRGNRHRHRHQLSLSLGRSVFITIFVNITIIITSKINIIVLVVCVD